MMAVRFDDPEKFERLQENLIQYVSWMEAILASTPDAILVLNDALDILRMNAAARALFSLPDDLATCTLENLLNGLAVDEVLITSIHYALQTGKPFQYDLHINERHYYMRVNPLPSAATQSGWVCLFQDQAERDSAEQRAVELALEREQINMLREFITQLSHDFRHPLSIISTNAYLMERTEDQAKRQARSINIAEQIDKLNRLVDSCLNIVREKEGRQHEFEAVEIATIVSAAVVNCKNLHRDKAAALDWIVESNPGMVMADTVELVKALIELLENAVLHTPSGGLIRVQSMTKRDVVTVTVQDTGIGIAADDLQHIFKPLYRSDQARNTDTGGAGLGLSIVKRIVEMHNGHVDVMSQMGEGSTFWLTLPRIIG